MTGAAIAVIVLAALLFGAGLLSLGLFFWFLLQNMQALRAAVDKLAAVAQPIADDKTLKNIGPSIAALSQYAPIMNRTMRDMTETMKVWNQLVIRAEKRSAPAEPSPAPPVEETAQSGVYYNSEEDFGRKEKLAELRKSGIRIDEAEESAPKDATKIVLSET